MQTPISEIRVDNQQVRVSEVLWEPGHPRPAYRRETSQVVVFLESCTYQRTDPATGDTVVRHRSAGEVLWHEAGEEAPELTNVGEFAYRTLLIELKKAVYQRT